MRWEGLFEDLETQWAAEERRDLDAEIADRTRAERSRVELAERYAASRGNTLTLALVTGSGCTGRLTDIGANWVLLRDATGREMLVATRQVVSVLGLSQRADPAVTARRFGLGMRCEPWPGTAAPDSHRRGGEDGAPGPSTGWGGTGVRSASIRSTSHDVPPRSAAAASFRLQRSSRCCGCRGSPRPTCPEPDRAAPPLPAVTRPRARRSGRARPCAHTSAGYRPRVQPSPPATDPGPRP